MIQNEPIEQVISSLTLTREALKLELKNIDKIIKELKSKVTFESDFKKSLKNFNGKSQHKDLWGKPMGKEID